VEIPLQRSDRLKIPIDLICSSSGSRSTSLTGDFYIRTKRPFENGCAAAWQKRRLRTLSGARASEPYPRTIADIQAALEAAGIEFIEENGGGSGLRFRKKAKR
jgi:hypothetical protein